jgi:hypothetical protein
MTLTALQDARRRITNATQDLDSLSKTVINDLVKDLLQADDINNVTWAQRGSEYSDEGMYPGIAGPFLNAELDDRDDYYDYIDTDDYDKDPRIHDLKAALDAIGEDILSDIFGDEYMVIATLREDGTVNYESEYVGV